MSLAVKEYGQALYDLAREEGIEEALLADCRAVRALFCENPGYARLLSRPDVPKTERTALLDEAFSARVHPYLLSFLKLICERGYAWQTVELLSEFERLYRHAHGIVTAEVESAVALSDAQRTRLAAKLSAVTGKTVELHCRENAALLGGVRLTVENTLFEGSVRAKLDELAASLHALTI